MFVDDGLIWCRQVDLGQRLRGKATIIEDGEELTLEHDQSIYIKKGVKHQLINNEKINLEIIEIQTGTKVSEEDIQRFEDIYGRVTDNEY